MIDVCFSRTASGILNFLKKDIDSEAVFHLGGYFDTGDISENTQEHYAKEEAETLRYFYKDISEEKIADAYKDELKQIHTRYTKFKKHLSNGESVRVWICRNANDYCGFFWLCSEMKSLSNKLSVVVCPTYEYSVMNRKYMHTFGWGVEPETLLDVVHSAKELNAEEKEFFAKEWKLLVEENKPLRILINDTVISTGIDFLDSAILSFVPETPTKQSEIMGNFLGSWRCCSVSFISERIEQMIAKDQIKICEDIVDDHGCYWPRKIAKV